MQWRFDRYRIFYVRKIILGQVPNVGLQIGSDRSARQGLKLKVPVSRKYSALYLNSFAIRGPKIFNILPRELRNSIDSNTVFKSKLDEFLSKIPDEPRIICGISSARNDLEYEIGQWKNVNMYQL